MGSVTWRAPQAWVEGVLGYKAKGKQGQTRKGQIARARVQVSATGSFAEMKIETRLSETKRDEWGERSLLARIDSEGTPGKGTKLGIRVGWR